MAGAPRVRAGPRTQRQRALRHVRPGHGARGRPLPALRGLEPAARLAAREHVVPARRPLPLLPPRALRRRRAAGLPGRAGALRLALRHRRGRRGHPRREGLPGALERVREGPARPLRGAAGRGPALAGHRAQPGSPGAAPASSTRAGRRTGPSWPTGTAASTARRESGAPRRTGEDLGLAAEIPANGTFALLSPTEAVVAVEDYYRYYWLWSDLWRVDLDTGRRTRLTEGERATDPDVRARRRLRRLRGPGGPRGDGARAALARGRDAPRPSSTSPARRSTCRASPRTACASPSSSRWGRAGTSPSGRTAGWSRVTNDDALDTSPEWLPGRPPALLLRPDRHLRPLPLRAGAGRLARHRRDGARRRSSRPDPDTLLSLVPPLPPLPAPPPSRRCPGLGPPGVLVVPGTVRRVTNSAMGAMQPAVSPDGRQVAYVSYSRAGYDLARLDLPAGPLPEAPARRAPPRPGSPTTGTPAIRPSPTTRCPCCCPATGCRSSAGTPPDSRWVHSPRPRTWSVSTPGRPSSAGASGRPPPSTTSPTWGSGCGRRSFSVLEPLDQLRPGPDRGVRGGLDAAARVGARPHPRALPPPLGLARAGAAPSTGRSTRRPGRFPCRTASGAWSAGASPTTTRASS